MHLKFKSIIIVDDDYLVRVLCCEAEVSLHGVHLFRVEASVATGSRYVGLMNFLSIRLGLIVRIRKYRSHVSTGFGDRTSLDLCRHWISRNGHLRSETDALSERLLPLIENFRHDLCISSRLPSVPVFDLLWRHYLILALSDLFLLPELFFRCIDRRGRLRRIHSCSSRDIMLFPLDYFVHHPAVLRALL